MAGPESGMGCVKVGQARPMRSLPRCGKRNLGRRLFNGGTGGQQFVNVRLEDLGRWHGAGLAIGGGGGGIGSHSMVSYTFPPSVWYLYVWPALCLCIRFPRVVSWQAPCLLTWHNGRCDGQGWRLGAMRRERMGRAGRIVKELGRGGASVKVVPQPVKVIVSQTRGSVNNVFCKQESSMISGTYARAWARGRRRVRRGPSGFGRRFR